MCLDLRSNVSTKLCEARIFIIYYYYLSISNITLHIRFCACVNSRNIVAHRKVSCDESTKGKESREKRGKYVLQISTALQSSQHEISC